MSDAPLLEVGRTGRAHGVRGEIAVDLLTEREERLAPGSRLLMGERWVTVATSRRAGTRWLVRFEGVDDRTAAEALGGLPLRAEFQKSSSSELELWVHELIGSDVIDVAGRRLGRCVAVVANPAHDLLELEGGALIPAVFVRSHEPGVVVVEIPEGLVD